MLCPLCQAEITEANQVCPKCGAPVNGFSPAAHMRPLSRIAYYILRYGKERLAVLLLVFLTFSGGYVTLDHVIGIYEPLTAAAGLEQLDIREPALESGAPPSAQKPSLFAEKAQQAHADVRRHVIWILLGLLLFTVSLLLLVRIFFIAQKTTKVRCIVADESVGNASTCADAKNENISS